MSPQHLTPQLYPVSVSSHPPFTMLVPLMGQGDLQACSCTLSFLAWLAACCA